MARIRDFQGRLFWGLLLVLIGAIFLLGSLDKLDVGFIFSKYWPILIILVGIWSWIANDFRSIIPGLILVVLGVFFMLAKLDVVSWGAWYLIWPVLIIIAGLWLILKPAFRGAGKAPEIKADDLNAFVIFAGLKRRITSQDFRGGKATALLGGLEIDFTKAALAENKATVELTAALGGIEVRVPREWQVAIDGSPILGGIEDKHESVPPSEVKATLYVRATAILGGIEIKN